MDFRNTNIEYHWCFPTTPPLPAPNVLYFQKKEDGMKMKTQDKKVF